MALIAVKPEVNAITEEQLQTSSPFRAALLFSMTNGGMKYMPDRLSYQRITWESQSAMVMEGTAEAWVEAVADVLKTL